MPSIYATAPPTTILATSLPSPAPTIPPVPIPTSQPVPAPTTVSLTLLACDFDASLCGFSNTGNYEWTRISGSTPSSNTGPSGDATSGSGSYVYVEATWPNSPNKGPFALTSPPFSACVGSVQFSYHMLGFSMGVLELEEMTNGIWTMIWSKTGNQGNGWRAATVTTSAFVSQVRFVGTTGTSFSGDMSIDDVTIFSGSGCILPSPAPTTNPTTPHPSTLVPTSFPTTAAPSSETAPPTVSSMPSSAPTTSIPSAWPAIIQPTMIPTAMPLAIPTILPTAVPMMQPTLPPTASPMAGPTAHLTETPSPVQTPMPTTESLAPTPSPTISSKPTTCVDWLD